MSNQKKNPKRNTIFPLILVLAGLLLLGGLAWGMRSREAAGTEKGSTQSFSVIPVEMNKPAPELDLVDVSGEPVSLDDYAGQVVLVNHWATWCPPCRAEMPELESYYQTYKGDGFVLVAINAGESVEDVNPFVEEFGLNFPVWIDSNGDALQAFGTTGLPTSFVVDETGTTVLTWSGAISLEGLEEFVTPILNQ